MPIVSLWLLSVGSALVVVSDADTEPYRQAVAALRQVEPSLERFATDDPSLGDRLSRAGVDDLWVALGSRAAMLVAKAPGSRKAAALVKTAEVPPGLSAVTLEVDANRLAGWLTTAFAPRRRLAFLVGSAASSWSATPGTIELVRVRSSADAVSTLARALSGREKESVVYVAPDPGFVTADSVPPLIEAALAARVPIVGFSPYFLRLGALAAIDIDFGAAAVQALRLAQSGRVFIVAPDVVRLVVDGRLSERLGVAVHGGDEIEVRR
jgi:hypothetical protein